jgi:hypothetical protein
MIPFAKLAFPQFVVLSGIAALICDFKIFPVFTIPKGVYTLKNEKK